MVIAISHKDSAFRCLPLLHAIVKSRSQCLQSMLRMLGYVFFACVPFRWVILLGTCTRADLICPLTCAPQANSQHPADEMPPSDGLDGRVSLISCMTSPHFCRDFPTSISLADHDKNSNAPCEHDKPQILIAVQNLLPGFEVQGLVGCIDFPYAAMSHGCQEYLYRHSPPAYIK